ncbi:MAG: hypothetical protein KDH96_08770, partial [Candidatus Riesia sp.]|nr:hypothetical protein [Candidatus Riesia sp.]
MKIICPHCGSKEPIIPPHKNQLCSSCGFYIIFKEEDPIKIICDCGTTLTALHKMSGRKAKCSNCSINFTIPKYSFENKPSNVENTPVSNSKVEKRVEKKINCRFLLFSISINLLLTIISIIGGGGKNLFFEIFILVFGLWLLYKVVFYYLEKHSVVSFGVILFFISSLVLIFFENTHT